MSDICGIVFNTNSWGYKACKSILDSGSTTSRCGVSAQGATIQQKSESDAQIILPPVQVGDAKVGGEGGITVNDAGVTIIPAPYLINIARDRAQGTDIKIAPIRLTMPNAGNKTIKIIVETVPGTLDPSLAGIDGLINITKPDTNKQAQLRVPVYMGAYNLEDKTNKISTVTQETCSAATLLNPQIANDAGVTQNCENYRIQAKGSQNAYEFIVPKEAYAKDNSLDINYGFTLRVNTSSMIPGHKYMLYLKVRLVVGGPAANVDSGTTTVDTGASLDAGVPAPDTAAPDAGMPDAGVPDKGTSE